MSQTQAFRITVTPLAYNVKTIFTISLSHCLTELIIPEGDGFRACLLCHSVWDRKKKAAISLEWGAITPPYKKDKRKPERMTGRVGETKGKFCQIANDQMSSTGTCVI